MSHYYENDPNLKSNIKNMETGESINYSFYEIENFLKK